MKNKIIGLSIGIFVSLVIVIIMSILVSNSGGAPLNIDIAIRDFFYSIRGEKNGFIYYLFRIITDFGYIYAAIITIIIVLIFTRGNNKTVAYILGILLMILINYVIKDIYGRERPLKGYRWMVETDTSYPSGHSTTIGFIGTYFIFLFYDSNYKKVFKIICYVISGLLMLLVPISRLVLGMHYFTDILSGLSCGILVGLLMALFTILLKKIGVLEKPLFDMIVDYFKNKKNKDIE